MDGTAEPEEGERERQCAKRRRETSGADTGDGQSDLLKQPLPTYSLQRFSLITIC